MTVFQPFYKKDIDLDEWTKEIIKWHFSEETGSEFWLGKKNQLGFNPIARIKTFEDLELFGKFDDEELKKAPMDSLIPRGFKNNSTSNFRVFETGGTLGVPKRIIDCTYRKEIAKWVSYSLDKHNFPKEGNWLHLGPSGPHVVGHTTAEIANIRGKSLCYFVDIDTRWIKVMVKNGDKKSLNQYIDHVLFQAANIIETQNISCIMTTPKLLPALADRISLSKIKGIIIGGTHVTKAYYKLLKNEITKEIPLCINYGNTLMGVAPSVKCTNPYDINYYGLYPYFILKVVDDNSYQKCVEYNNKGRVCITVLTKDYFIPNMLERDEAIRIPGNDDYPWDGVSDVAPFAKIKDEIIEGVY